MTYTRRTGKCFLCLEECHRHVHVVLCCGFIGRKGKLHGKLRGSVLGDAQICSLCQLSFAALDRCQPITLVFYGGKSTSGGAFYARHNTTVITLVESGTMRVIPNVAVLCSLTRRVYDRTSSGCKEKEESRQ